MAKKFVDDISVNTIVGVGAFVNGGITSPGLLKIDGDVNGDVVSKGRIIISDTARIRGNIRANSVIVGGIISGDIIAPESVIVSSGSVVIGSIITKHLRVEDNVLLNGYCYAKSNPADFDDAERTYKNKQALATSTMSKH